jgi:hypothetical protein
LAAREQAWSWIEELSERSHKDRSTLLVKVPRRRELFPALYFALKSDA